MERTYDIRLTGTLTAITPVSIVTPNAVVDKLPGGGKATRLASRDVVREDGTVVTVPVITASTIRGKIRRSAFRVCRADADVRPGLKALVYSVLGGIKGAESEDIFSIGKRNQRRLRNPVVALLGASVPWDASRLIVSDAIPVHDVTPMLVSGTRTDEFARNADIAEIVDNSAFGDYQKLREGTRATSDAKGEVTKLIQKRTKAAKDGQIAKVAELDAQIAAARRAAEESAMESGNSMQMPFAYYAIPQGTRFRQDILLKDVTMAEVGLFLAALDEMFDVHPEFGGKVGEAYGRVAAEWAVDVRERRPARTPWNNIGAITGKPYEGVIAPDQLSEEAAAAWRAYLDSGVMDLTSDATEAEAAAAAEG